MKEEKLGKVGNERESNIELLRIVAIFFVVFSHFCVHSQFVFPTGALSLNQILVQMGAIGEIGVSIFILITGFYSVKGKSSIKKIVYILIEVWLYNVIILILTQLLSKDELSFAMILKNILPIYNTHWFVYTYMFLYALSPFINKLLINMDQNTYQKLLIMLWVSWGIVYTFTGADLNYSYLVWFIFVYMVGAYVRLYGSEKPNRVPNFLSFCICTCLMIISTILIDIVGLRFGFYPQHGNHFYSLHSPLVLGIAFSLFQLFRGFKIKHNKFINMIAGTTLAIYLISDNTFVRLGLWNDVFKNGMHSDNHFLIFIGIIEVLIVCIVCATIDIVRRKLFELKPLVKLMQAICKMIERIFSFFSSVVWKLVQKVL